MHENVEMPTGSRPWIIQQPRAARLQSRHARRKIGDLDGDMMQPLASLDSPKG